MQNKSHRDILVMFGGISPEHEVSIVTGLQALEALDFDIYIPHVVFVSKHGEFFYLPNLRSRKGFLRSKRMPVSFGRNKKGGFIRLQDFTGTKIYPYASLLAFHGGGGEGGAIQGLLDSCGIAYTSPATEGSVIAMNKQIAKILANHAGINTVPGISFYSSEIHKDVKSAVDTCVAKLETDLIVKPAHFGSSIAITITHSAIELEKALLMASQIDSEVLVEKLLTDFVEYNCSVRMVDGKIEVSEIERPLSRDEILSFAEKYEQGNKNKTSAGQGMASLSRELPAKISDALKEKIQKTARAVFKATRQKGMVRIDFMYTNVGHLYLAEVNSIPGSLSFYLWESGGISYTAHLSALIETSRAYYSEAQSKFFDHHSDIVKKFIDQ